MPRSVRAAPSPALFLALYLLAVRPVCPMRVAPLPAMKLPSTCYEVALYLSALFPVLFNVLPAFGKMGSEIAPLPGSLLFAAFAVGA